MSTQIRASHPIYNLLPTEIEGFGALAELALDMRWSWNHATDEVWRQLDPELWDLTHNPWVVLQTVSRDQIERMLAELGVCQQFDDLVQTRRQLLEEPAWFQQTYPDSPLSGVAYFSMEFMLSEALPIYSGGLGNVAGDQLKATSDLGIPAVGVGLLYQQGYFRQVIDKNGAQQALFPYNDAGQLPIAPLRHPNGEWLRLQVALPGYSIWLRAWQVQVGRVKLYLLDSNDAANFPAHRGITSELNPQYPVQLILAGKAHPEDRQGQALIQAWTSFIQRPEARQHVIFLSDYDMLLTEQLVQGVDVWINTPRRPWEASGTSGMKVLVNGGINLSELDGWWAEAYTPEVRWALGDGQEHGDDPAWDAAEANALYDLLEQQVIPEFYTRDEQGIPVAWVRRMRESMARLTPHFSANRTVREYTEQHYLPAAAAYRKRSANRGEVASQIVNGQQTLDRQWATLCFGAIYVTSDADTHTFNVEVKFGSLDPQRVRVELYADGVKGGEPERHEMRRGQPLSEVGDDNAYRFSAQIPATRSAEDYTARVIPYRNGVAIPLEDPRILWQRWSEIEPKTCQLTAG
jgi:glucan phosphorylase